jgi:hypothetical protein
LLKNSLSFVINPLALSLRIAIMELRPHQPQYQGRLLLLTALAKYSTKPVSSVLKARTTHDKQELFINDH